MRASFTNVTHLYKCIMRILAVGRRECNHLTKDLYEEGGISRGQHSGTLQIIVNQYIRNQFDTSYWISNTSRYITRNSCICILLSELTPELI